MLMTILKIVTGVAVRGIVALVLLAVVCGVASSICDKPKRKSSHETT
jgi:hypothetical protein